MRRLLFWSLLAFSLVVTLSLAGLWAYVYFSLEQLSVTPDKSMPHFPYPAPLPQERISPPRVRVAKVGTDWQLVDAKGRVMVLHGVNLDRRGLTLGDEGPLIELRSFGINAIDLMVPWESLEPSPRHLSIETLTFIRWFLEAARGNGMLVVLDNRQLSACHCGIPAPLWTFRPELALACEATGACYPDFQPGLAGLPPLLRWWMDFWEGRWTPDDITLQDHLIWTWQKVAEVVHDHPALLGYAAMATPVCPGLQLWNQVRIADCQGALSDFLGRFAFAVNAVDPDSLVFFDLPSYILGSTDLSLRRPPVPGAVLAVRSIGQMAATCKTPWRRERCDIYELLHSTRDLAYERFDTLRVLLEHGVRPCRPHSVLGLAHQLMDVEDSKASSFVRGYRTRSAANTVSTTEATLACPTASLVRPVPRFIAGEPISWGFDRTFDLLQGQPDRHHDGTLVTSTDAFTLTFRQTSVIGETVVYVPRTLVYGEDPTTEAPEFTVDVSDGQWYWSTEDPNLLIWNANPSVPEHKLALKTWGGQRAKGVAPCDAP